jgi:hypothetical protein
MPVCDFRKCGGILFIIRLNLVQQRGQAGARPAIPYDSIPCHIAVQLWQKDWQILDQFLTFNWRKHPNRSFDFAGSTHLAEISTRRRVKQYMRDRFRKAQVACTENVPGGSSSPPAFRAS